MHATPHTNLFGVTTHYGTHPKQPAPNRLRLAAQEAATWIAAIVATIRRPQET